MVTIRGDAVGGVRSRAAGTLIDRALALLAGGPATTAAVALEVLSLSGNPSVAAAAVFSLLATDDRFQVDADGIWSLGRLTMPVGPSLLRDEEWAVVDVETTGGSPAHGDRIIEIAVVRVAGGRITDRYTTLVNPGRPIPRIVSSLTGISNDEVSRAPRFEAVAQTLTSAVGGRVFVGHNANFDWRFLCAELERCSGRTLNGRRLCTLRLAKRIVPNLQSRALGALADHFGIEMETHHRALDDAEATARLLIEFLAILEDRQVTEWRSLEAFFRKRQARKRRRTAMPRSMDIA